MDIKQQILNANDCAVQSKYVKEWNTTVYVKKMTLGELIQVREVLATIDDEDPASGLHTMTTFLVKCLCDETGNRLFDDSEKHMLETRSSAVLNDVFSFVAKVNGMGGDAGEEAKKD